jgi:hypothetical protein
MSVAQYAEKHGLSGHTLYAARRQVMAAAKAACSPRYAASIRFLFVRPAFCLRLPSDSASRRTPLPFG